MLLVGRRSSFSPLLVPGPQDVRHPRAGVAHSSTRAGFIGALSRPSLEVSHGSLSASLQTLSCIQAGCSYSSYYPTTVHNGYDDDGPPLTLRRDRSRPSPAGRQSTGLVPPLERELSSILT
ncbi:unnamed protein product [Nippostrongylus brasiliensis]|uniref:Uncharacterized protein n=1 Tax=Nippostrongylus brasiliensis TaxID=27835 RepID=A0A0N4Y5X5_NIPBR|nr:unnamed protein product [Nippostrongylus brasiliensis]